MTIAKELMKSDERSNDECWNTRWVQQQERVVGEQKQGQMKGACQQESMIVQQKRSNKKSMMHSAMAGECDSATQAGAR